MGLHHPASSLPISKMPQAGILEAQGAVASLRSQDVFWGRSLHLIPAYLLTDGGTTSPINSSRETLKGGRCHSRGEKQYKGHAYKQTLQKGPGAAGWAHSTCQPQAQTFTHPYTCAHVPFPKLWALQEALSNFLVFHPPPNVIVTSPGTPTL